MNEYKYIQWLVISHEIHYLPVSWSIRLFVRRACLLQSDRYRSDIRLSSFLLASNALPRNDIHCTRGSENRSTRSGYVTITQRWLVPEPRDWFEMGGCILMPGLWCMGYDAWENLMHWKYNAWGIWCLGNMMCGESDVWWPFCTKIFTHRSLPATNFNHNSE